jgi:hypothetical protein
MSKQKNKNITTKNNLKSTKDPFTYGYIAIRFLDDSFCFFINAFAEVVDDDCCVYSKSCGHHTFPKSQVETIRGDNLLIWKNNSLFIKGSNDDRKKKKGL